MERLLTVAVIHLLACLSPGPDIFLVVRTSMRCGWRSGIHTTAGILTGVTLHITLGIAGITLIIAQSRTLASLLALAGGAWLIYLGGQGLREASRRPAAGATVTRENGVPMSFPEAWSQGLLVNLLNPKALLFFLSLFSVLLGPGVPLPVRTASGLVMLAVQALAFSGVAILVDRTGFRNRWPILQIWLDRIISLVLLGIGLWIWISTIASLAA